MPADATVAISKCLQAELPTELTAVATVIGASPLAPAPVTAPLINSKHKHHSAFQPPVKWCLKPPCLPAARMTYTLNPAAAAKAAAPISFIIRPLRLRGSFLQQWDVYISRACVYAGIQFLESPFAVPEACVDYAAHLRAQCIASAPFRAALAELHGKRLACWCVQGTANCHGHTLVAAAAAAAAELKRAKQPVIVRTRANPTKRPRA